jgi:hypothetical protein
MGFKRIVTNNGNRDAVFISFDNDTVNIILPSIGVVNFDKDGFIRMLNYMRGYEYTLAVQNSEAKYYKESKELIGFFVEGSNNELITIEFGVTKKKVVPDVRFKKYDTTNGKIISDIALNANTFSRIINEAKLAGIDTAVEYIEEIKFVDKLPAETSAKRFTVYFFNNKYYILNANEDELIELEGNFYERPNFPAITPDAKEGVLYNLLNKQDQPPWLFEQGIYTYIKNTNTFKLEDLKVYKTDRLPATDKANETLLYVMTRDEKDNDGVVIHAKNTMWKYDTTEEKYVHETRELKNVSKLPIKELAVDGVFYIVNGNVQKFDKTVFVKIGELVKCKDSLPDVSKIQLDKNIVYTLTKNDGDRVKGSNWIFNMTTKEFNEYVDPSTITKDKEDTGKEEGSGDDNGKTDDSGQGSGTDTTGD